MALTRINAHLLTRRALGWRVLASLGCLWLCWQLWRPPVPDLAWQQVQTTHELVFAVDATFPPFAYLDENAEYAGFDIELARLLTQELQLTPVFQLYAYDGLIGTLVSGRTQAAVSAQVALPNRLHEAHYTQAYFNAGAVLLCWQANCPLNGQDMREWAEGKTIAVELGSQGDVLTRRWQKAGVKFERLVLDDQLQAFAALQAEQANGALGEPVGAGKFLQNNAQLRQLPAEDVGYVILVGANSEKLLTALNQALQKLEQSGQLPSLRTKWFGASFEELRWAKP